MDTKSLLTYVFRVVCGDAQNLVERHPWIDGPGRACLLCLLIYPHSSHQPDKMSMKAVSLFYCKFVCHKALTSTFSLEKDRKKSVYTWTTSSDTTSF